MTVTLTMPEVAETVVEGTISRWLKGPGDSVELYESLVEVVTDKVNVELPSPATGVLTEILVAEGETVPVGTPLALMEAEGGLPVEVEEARPAEAETVPARAEPAPVGRRDGASGRRDKRYSPLVLKLASDHNVDLDAVQGTGAAGRITKADVLQHVEQREAAVHAQSEAPDGDEIIDSPVRRAIAQRMEQSVREIPHAWTMMEADVTGLVALVKGAKEEFHRQQGVNLTYLPFFIQSVVNALKEHPLVNSTWTEGKIVLKQELNIGVAVAREEGLIVPVIKDVGRKPVAALAREIHELVEKARRNKLAVQDVQGGTFTVNNTGALGSVLSGPIINPPQCGIVTSEAVVKRPVVVNDAIAIRSMMNVCLSFDHRILDGSNATAFLRSVKDGLEAIGPDTAIC